MSKAHRGKGIRSEAAHGRGTCPICKRENVKILYEQEAGEIKIKICKNCRASIKHGKRSLADAGLSVPVKAEAAPAAAPAPEAAAPAVEAAAAEGASVPAEA
jgi:hypothetical protein